MGILPLSLLSLIFSILTHIHTVNWLCIAGFVFGITAWVMSRKIVQTTPQTRFARLSMLLGVVGTFTNLAGILLAFVWGNLMSGGFVVF